MPVQPSVSKSEDPTQIKFEFNQKVYETNKFIEHQIADVEVLGTLRGMHLARLVVSPLSYNPVTGIIRILNDIEIDVNFSGADKALAENIKTATYSPYFEPVYDAVLNKNFDKDLYDDYPDLTKYPVKYVIISDRMFEETLQDFIEWKTKKGFDVIVEYTDEIGSSITEVQTYLHDMYNAATEEDPAPSFVLFVGDTPQIPASATGSSSGKKTDLYYCSVDGDYFPEMYYGRFSATSAAMLQNIIDKTLYYEQYQFEDASYLDRVTLIAGADGTWNPSVGQPTVIYGTENYFNTAHGYTTVNDYLSSPYNEPYETVNEGVGFINYTAHCSETSWGDPNLGIGGVNAFTNENMYPLAVGNCCLAADFGYGECIGETWLRGENKGAVAYIGSSPSSYWYEDFYWSVGAFGNPGGGYVPTVEETTLGAYDAPFTSDYVSVDAMLFVGNLAVTEVDVQGYPQHSSPTYYWQAYNCLGDPSLVIYHTQGEINEVSYMDILPIGVDQYDVTAEAGSYVAISFDGVLHGTAMVGETGIVTVPITPILEAGNADIVVTKPQYQPYIAQVIVAPLDGPYVLVDSTSISDPEGNGNNEADYGETVSINAFLKNVGTELAEAVEVTVSTDDEYVTLTDDSEVWGDIAADGTVSVNAAFTFSISDMIGDQHVVSFSVSANDNSAEEPWNSSFSCSVNAPVLSLTDISINDEEGGNNNGRLDAGEMVILSVNAMNTGHANSVVSNCILTTRSDYLSIITEEIEVGELPIHGVNPVSYEVIIDPETPIGTIVDFTITLTAGNYMATTTLSKKVGLVLEDFETGDLTAFEWDNDVDYPWVIETEEVYEGSYSVKSGTIGDEQSTDLELTLEVGAADVISFYKKVSSEGGYDYLKFYIDGSEMGAWDGESDWSFEEYDVNSGTHTFKWAYEKDYSVSNGSDCAWIDLVVLPGGSGGSENNMPEFMSFPDTVAVTGVEYMYEIQVNDEDGDEIELTAPMLPEWLTLTDNGDGSGTLSGTPVTEDYGEHMFIVQACDGIVFNSLVVELSVVFQDNVENLVNENFLNIYPNPFKDNATLTYTLDETSKIEIVIFDAIGHKVFDVVNLVEQNPGTYNYTINNKFEQGIYFCKFTVNNEISTIPVIVTK
ncbi:C25 family cysteine peptidase [Bacteroidota bacterium]